MSVFYSVLNIGLYLATLQDLEMLQGWRQVEKVSHQGRVLREYHVLGLVRFLSAFTHEAVPRPEPKINVVIS